MSVRSCKTYTIETPIEYSLLVLKELVLFNNFEIKKQNKSIDFHNVNESIQKVTSRNNDLESIIKEYYLLTNSKKPKNTVDLTEDILKRIDKYSKKIKRDIDTSLDIIKRVEDLSHDLERVTHDLSFLEPLKDIEEMLFMEFHLISVFIVKVSPEKQNELDTILEQNPDTDIVHTVKYSEEADLNIIVTPSTKEDEIRKSLQLTNFDVLVLHRNTEHASPHKVYEEFSLLQEQTKKELSDIVDRFIKINKDQIDLLETLIRINEIELESLHNLENIRIYESDINTTTTPEDNTLKNSDIKTDYSLNSIVTISGWMDEAQEKYLQKRLQNIAPQVELVPSSTLDESRTIIKNSFFIKPFEVVTKLMGNPSIREIDPTPYLAPFFILFFGFALGDAGYGLLMVLLATYVMFFKQNVTVAQKATFLLIMYCGLSTIFFGAITGSWFGITLEEGTNSLTDFLLSLKIVDVQASLLDLLIIILGVGLLQQFFGLILSMSVYIKQKDLSSALQKPGTWILLLSSIIFLIATGNVEALNDYQNIAQYILIAAIVLFMFGQGKDTKNIFLRPFIGLTKVFSITTYLSNTLSYARILALGLATSVIASVVNLIAFTFGNKETFIGIIIAILIILIGHVFNLAMNLLGTFINVARLQLVEFLPSFFEGQGDELQPVGSNLKLGHVSSKISSKQLKVI